MGILYADTDAKLRNEILSSTKHLIVRLRGATAYLVREIQRLSFTGKQDPSSQSSPRLKFQDSIEELVKLLDSHTAFIQWYLEFLLGELIPTAAYQRHITALKAIMLLLQSGIIKKDPSSKIHQVSGNETVWPFYIKFFTLGAMRLLLDLLMDPFEDVRINAAAVLKYASKDSFGTKQPVEYVDNIEGIFSLSRVDIRQPTRQISPAPASVPMSDQSLCFLQAFISRADERTKRTGRADYADGLARCYALHYSLLSSASDRLRLVDDLISILEKKSKVAEKNLSQAVEDAPIHGTFAALK